ncbi:MAG TPA: S41 family peptidase [Salinisphaeraceae bacterium]|nr:S41 family peptidase [Salinisphaeraceae bacterium]
MNRQHRSLLLISLGIVIGILISIAQIGFADLGNGSASNLPLKELRTYVEIMDRIKKSYVEEVSDEELIENSIQGMLSGLDPHSSYLDPEAFKELSISTSGEFGGLGIQVQMENGFVRVVAPIDDTPAKKAGIESGDLIVRINGDPVKGMTLTDAVKIMRGEPGTEITLTIVREGEDGPFKVTLERAKIEVKSVKSRILDNDYGYVRISHFSDHTGDTLRAEINKLKEEADGPLRGIVLDLRDNPGGVLKAAVSVSDAFLDHGKIVSIRGRRKNTDQQFDAKAGDVLNDKPIVVLVNEGSASASEIVAGAMQDNGRAIIMGRQTFGKGSVQTVLPMENGAAIKLTTARYYTPSGNSIQAEGIKPDVVVGYVKVEAMENTISPLSEADLAGVLANDTNKEDDEGDSERDEDSNTTHLAEQDYALYEALNLLKALHIQRSRDH